MLIYVFNRAVYRVWEFLKHWYLGGFHVISHQAVNVLEILDRNIALRITLRYWLKPLYQDYTVLGYILGFILRTSRIIVGSFIYLTVILLASAVYLVWAVLPIYIIYRGV